MISILVAAAVGLGVTLLGTPVKVSARFEPLAPTLDGMAYMAVSRYADEKGDMHMPDVMRTLKQVGYSYMVMPDHMPRHDDDPRQDQAFAFGYGYIKALIQSVEA